MKVTKASIIGVTISGNLGGQIMLIAANELLKKNFPNIQIDLLSVFPAEDLVSERPEKLNEVHIVDSSPLKLVLLYLPLALLFGYPSRFSKSLRNNLSRIAYFKSLFESDCVVDLCGVAFIDHRGLSLLAYNVACVLPALLCGTPVFKLAQALGPFKTPLNHVLAKAILGHCKVVVARGAKTNSYLQALGLKNISTLPDISFSLEIDEATRKKALQLLPTHAGAVVAPITISPSRVVDRYCRANNIDLTAEIATLIDELQRRGFHVVLLAHSRGTANKNDDVTLCQNIFQACSDKSKLSLIVDVFDSLTSRAVIGQALVFIGCRFHSVVASLATATPTIVIGWSHKYREMVAPFDIDECVFDWRDFTSTNFLDVILKVVNENAAYRSRISTKLIAVRQDAKKNIGLIANYAASL